ncbi:MAG: ribonuclease HII [Candidatus Limivicinus sp.]|nr:ribonuclease HII [Clostridiales bacterium]MDY6133039.1 ribonuclease HII [Candidatus Limivicinus sp.]
MIELWTLENEIYAGGVKRLCGVDEAGRGPLAGPVCAAAVILPQNCEIQGLNDSKKLTEKKREALFDLICAAAVSYGIAFATVEEIEEYNILGATFMAMNRAVAMLDPVPELALIDGNRNTGIQIPSRCIVGGDGKCADIAAASVLAKVTRDRYMRQMAELYPQYGFEKHKGYGTKAHYDAIRAYGPSPIHRPSFLRKMH